MLISAKSTRVAHLVERAILLGLAFFFLRSSAAAQERTQVVIKEPGIIPLENLFRTADVVVSAKIVSGDTESYGTAIYKGVVLKAFKGLSEGDSFYFGPYVGSKLGWEYVLFLRSVSDAVVPKDAAKPGYGPVNVLQVFDEGYSSMETSYRCVFKGKDPSESCGYAVRICTGYVALPKTLPTSPSAIEDAPFGCKWVRKETLSTVLVKLSGKDK